MPYFAAEARRLLRNDELSELRTETLTYMVQNCIGAADAQPIDRILAHLRSRGITVLKSTFQHHVLGWSRDSTNVYIASSRDGIYLIRARRDADPMMQFYEERIAAERARLERLRNLIAERWED